MVAFIHLSVLEGPQRQTQDVVMAQAVEGQQEGRLPIPLPLKLAEGGGRHQKADHHPNSQRGDQPIHPEASYLHVIQPSLVLL